jgi:hypothetical protein
MLDLLDILDRNVSTVDLGEVHRLLVACLAPLNSWTAAMVMDVQDALAYEYVCMASLLDLARNVVHLDKAGAGLSESDKEHIALCINLAEDFLKSQDVLYDAMGTRFVAVGTTVPAASANHSRRVSIGNLWKKVVGRGSSKDDK